MYAGKEKMRYIVLIFFLVHEAVAAQVPVGKVVYLSGVLTAQQPGGNIRILAPKSDVYSEDTLRSEEDTFGLIKFTDGGKITLRPNSVLNIHDYRFKEKNPGEDNVVFHLIKGGMRSVSGLIGKRGNHDAYKIQTVTATIGIRGSDGDTMDCVSSSGGLCADAPKGVYHATYRGAYIMYNEKGSQLIGAGEFGYAKSQFTPPVLLPKDPGFNHIPIPSAVTASTQETRHPISQCVIK